MVHWNDLKIEKNFYLDINESNKERIVNTFIEADIAQLPVIDNGKVIGIIDLFQVIKSESNRFILKELLEVDIITVNKDKNIYDCNHIQQKVLPVIDKNDTYIGYISKQVAVEYFRIETYKEIENELDTIIESSYDGIFILDGNGYILNINFAAERIDGIEREKVIGKHVQELLDEGIYDESVTLNVLKQKKQVTVLQKKKNGLETLATGVPVFKNGKIVRIVINVRDITELNDLKHELEDAYVTNLKYKKELETLRNNIKNKEHIISCSKQMKKILTLSEHIASVDSTVLLQGESGVGKGVISKFIHSKSKRNKEVFIKIDCGAIPENLLESEFFGYEKGAFTGAHNQGKIGLIELANNGTLFLDEISELPLNLQVKLLTVIQERKFYRIGGKNLISVDVRIITATNKDLYEMVREKNFREDLYYRLNVVPIFIPSLRERKEDIYPLIMFFLNENNIKYGHNKIIVSEALEALINYNWPGNTRELENMIERLVVITQTEKITLNNIPDIIKNYTPAKETFLNLNSISSFKKTMDQCEKKLLLYVMEKCNSTKEMSEILKIAPNSITRKFNKYNIKTKFKRGPKPSK